MTSIKFIQENFYRVYDMYTLQSNLQHIGMTSIKFIQENVYRLYDMYTLQSNTIHITSKKKRS